MSDPSPEQARLLAALRLTINADDPLAEEVGAMAQPGFYRLRRRRGAWAIPCEIRHLPDGLWQTVIDGVTFPPEREPHRAPGLVLLVQFGQTITEADYRYFNARRDSAPPDDPSRNPERRIDFNTLTPPAVPTRR